MKGNRLNDDEREMWVINDEGLLAWKHGWCRANKGGMRGFIRANRAELDRLITATRDAPPAQKGWRDYV